MSTPLLLIFCTVPDQRTAERLGEMLVAQGLAACVNISASTRSIYEWQGKIEQSDEVQLLIKTTKQRYQKCESALRAEHPYELPEIIAVPVEHGLDDFIKWVERCTNKPI
ncbi:MAG: divalent-cation tolerance protein CutA [Candidatus Thiodiazotropha sp.]|jgi:periplasmic divalent cation tolerance protein